jgi:hypothetical protein
MGQAVSRKSSICIRNILYCLHRVVHTNMSTELRQEEGSKEMLEHFLWPFCGAFSWTQHFPALHCTLSTIRHKAERKEYLEFVYEVIAPRDFELCILKLFYRLLRNFVLYHLQTSQVRSQAERKVKFFDKSAWYEHALSQILVSASNTTSSLLAHLSLRRYWCAIEELLRQQASTHLSYG